MGLLDLLKRLFGPSKKAREAAAEAQRKIEEACNQTADLTDLRKSLHKEKTRMRKKANEAISGITYRSAEEAERKRQKPLSRDEAERKLESFGWKERK